MAKKDNAEKQDLGLTVKKAADFSEWYNQLILKSELADYSPVSGCMVIRPGAYEIWEKIVDFFNSKIKKMGVRNVYFPMLIPEELLKKEKEHVEGFDPEVAWVTEAGSSKLKEKLAIRPTSETIMYTSYAKWIRSWRDLPLLLNQWNNVIRWEFKHARLFLRTREFLWQEGHTAFATKEEAERETLQILNAYRELLEDNLAVATTPGIKSEKEKFAGAVYTQTLEIMMPDGKVIQGATSHHLGQNFSKPFGIKFIDRDESEKYVWQNSWGITTRIIGIMAAVHGDDKGLVLPPKIAPVQAVIVPIFRGNTKEQVLEKAEEVAAALRKACVSVKVDDREEYSPGWKFNHWELLGIPLRIEIGPRDMEKKQVVIARRDTGQKTFVKESDVAKKVKPLLDSMQSEMLEKTRNFVKVHTKTAKDMVELKKHVDGNRVKACCCLAPECEERIKDETGAKISCIPLDEEKAFGKCVCCGEEARNVVYIARSY